MLRRIGLWLLWIVCFVAAFFAFLLPLSGGLQDVAVANGVGIMIATAVTGVWVPAALAIVGLRQAPRALRWFGEALAFAGIAIALFVIYRTTGLRTHLTLAGLFALGCFGYYYERVHRDWCSRAEATIAREGPPFVGELLVQVAIIAIEGLFYFVIEVIAVGITGEAVDLPFGGGGGSSGGGGGGGRW